MIFIRLPRVVFAAVIFLAGYACAQGPLVTASLSLKDNKSHYRSGEPIVVLLTLATDAPGLQLRGDASQDKIELAPAEGAYPWAEREGHGQKHPSDVVVMTNISAGHPVTGSITLNDRYRFDQAGTYKVQVTSERAGSGGAVTTNPVTFDVEPFSARDEQELALSLESRIRASNSEREADKLAKQLSYLPGDDATRVKLSLFLHPKTFYPFGVNLGSGLSIARNRAMIVAALEAALADPADANVSSVLYTLVQLRRSLLHPWDPAHPGADWPQDHVGADYVHQVALSLPRRTGESLVEAAQAVINRTRPENPDASLAREALIVHLAEVNEYTVGTLLNRHGKEMADARMVPALVGLINEKKDPIFSSNREAAIKELALIAPEQLHPYLIEEACQLHPAPIGEMRDLSPVDMLPAVDDCLAGKLDTVAAGPLQNGLLEGALEYAARFADGALLPRIRKAYLARDGSPESKRLWSQGAVGAALGYLMRWDPEFARPLLLKQLDVDEISLFSTVQSAPPQAPALRDFFRERVSHAGGNQAGFCAYELSQVGLPEDRGFLDLRLQELRRQGIVSAEDGRLEMELVESLLRGRRWESTAEEAKALGRSCVSEECRRHFGGL